MTTEYVLTGRDQDGRLVAEEITDAGKTATRIERSWSEAGLAVTVEERAVEIPPVCPVI